MLWLRGSSLYRPSKSSGPLSTEKDSSKKSKSSNIFLKFWITISGGRLQWRRRILPEALVGGWAGHQKKDHDSSILYNFALFYSQATKIELLTYYLLQMSSPSPALLTLLCPAPRAAKRSDQQLTSQINKFSISPPRREVWWTATAPQTSATQPLLPSPPLSFFLSPSFSSHLPN